MSIDRHLRCSIGTKVTFQYTMQQVALVDWCLTCLTCLTMFNYGDVGSAPLNSSVLGDLGRWRQCCVLVAAFVLIHAQLKSLW